MRALLNQTELAIAVTDVDEEYQWDHSFTRALRVPVEGIIAFDASASIDAFAKDYDRLAPTTPFVSMGAYWSESKSFVGVDLKAGAEEAMDHLLSTGRKKIAFMAPFDSGLLNSGVRYDAYHSKMEAAGLEPRTIAVEREALEPVMATLNGLILDRDEPDALLCMNDDLALAASFAMDRLGLRPGRDIAIVGFDGIQETSHCPCPITTVQQPIDEMCALTFQFLKTQMENPEAPLQQKILKPHLIVRESTTG
jgi:LacI family transcriptional regulator